ncbi:MAG: hypothetical protein R3B64_02350 [Candidatus Paceibacterota bacterium]
MCIIFPIATFATDVTISATVGSDVPETTGGSTSGSVGTSTTGVSFTGKAYPLSTIIILKDGQEIVETIAGPDATFSVFVGNLSSGMYTFSVLAEDSDGRRSVPFTFPIFITNGVTVYISGIFIAPTIALDKVSVKKGDTVSVFGQTAPNADVLININSANPQFFNTQSDGDGVYLYTLSSSLLDLGLHTAQSQAFLSGEATSYSNAVSFNVGDETEYYPSCGSPYDLNADCRINLVDFYILSYWYLKVAPPANMDFSKDGWVNMTDFSILAYYWTG